MIASLALVATTVPVQASHAISDLEAFAFGRRMKFLDDTDALMANRD